MKLGIIGRGDESGLSAMTQDFSRHMHYWIDRMLIVNRSGRGATNIKQFHSGLNPTLIDEITDETLYDWLPGLDAVVGFETFYNNNILPITYHLGIKTILFPMWECTPVTLSLCDNVWNYLFCVSDRDKQEYPEGIRLDWPVCDWEFKPRKNLNSHPKSFFISPGTGGLNNRNNTDLTVTALEKSGLTWFKAINCRQRRSLYCKGDVFIHLQGLPPLSLPILEASACRVPTLVMDIDGWKHYPDSMRIKPSGFTMHKIGGKELWYARPDLEHLAYVLDALATGKIEPELPPLPSTWEAFERGFAKALQVKELV